MLKPLRAAVTLLALAALCLLGLPPQAASALSLDEYFAYTVGADFSQDEVYAGEAFTAEISGEATCIQDLPFTASSATIKGRIVARHRTEDEEVTLNDSYTLTLNPFPNSAGESLESSVRVTLEFPEGSEPGEYDIVGELIEARVKVSFLQIPADSYLPDEYDFGSITLIADEEAIGGGGGLIVNPDDLAEYVSDAGKLLRDVELESADGRCSLLIGEGVVALDAAGRPVAEISITQVKAPLLAADAYIEVVGKVYELAPAGATFSPPLTLRLKYDAALLPRGLAETKLYIAWWNEEAGAWEKLASSVDVESRVISAEISHFSRFAVVAPARPASIAASKLDIVPAELRAGDTLSVSLVVSNSGDLFGRRDIALRINGLEVAARKVELDGGASQEITFSVDTAAYSPGSYSVEAGGLTGVFSVSPGGSPAAADGARPGASGQQPAHALDGEPLNWLIVAGIFGGVLVIGVLLYLLGRSRRRLRLAHRLLGVLRLPVYELTYDQLCTDPMAQLRVICDFLSLAPPPAASSAFRRMNRAPHWESLSRYDEIRAALAGTEYEPLLQQRP